MEKQKMMLLAISKNDILVELVVKGYESSLGSSWNDNNWLSCSAKLRFGQWHTEFQFFCFTTDVSDLAESLAALRDSLKTFAEFVPLEPDLNFRVSTVKESAYELKLVSSWRSSRGGELRSEVSLEFFLTREDICLLAEQAAKCSEVFPERGVQDQ